MPRKVPLPTPGEILLHDFPEPIGITQYRLANEIGATQRWINLQSHCDTEMARNAMEDIFSRIRRRDELSAAWNFRRSASADSWT